MADEQRPANETDAELKRRQRLERLPKVTSLYLRGRPTREIAARMGVSPRVIYQDIVVAKKLWAKATTRNTAELIRLELARINEMERTCWEGHQRSLKNALEECEMESDGAHGKSSSKRKSKRNQFGDPRYLSLIQGCWDRRYKLLKLMDEKDTESLQAKIVEVVVTNPEQVAAIIDYDTYEEITTRAKEEPA